MTGDSLLLRNVEVGGALVDVSIRGERIAALAPRLPPDRAAEELDGDGGALLVGLHDHHLHLCATAAALVSVATGPADVHDAAGLRRALQDADRSLSPGRWMRAVGYHETVAGDLDRDALDRIVPTRPLRVQDRSGVRWTLNSAAIELLRIEDRVETGIDRDAAGRPTGRLHRADGWLRDLLPPEDAPDLAAVGRRLAAVGVTGVTDTTPVEHPDDLDLLASAAASGALPQQVVVTGGLPLADVTPPPALRVGPVKLVIDDDAYPGIADLSAGIEHAHRAGRTVAIHCVTRTAAVLALAAWDVAGSVPGDRIEHGSVIPSELDDHVRRLGLHVVTQPGFVGERGDEYLRDVDADDLPHLYRCASLLDAGIRVAGSTDAPYTSADPWRAMRAATSRQAPSGAVVGGGEAVSAARALRLFQGDPTDPGGAPRRVEAGAIADLCLLAVPLAQALERLDANDVAATVCRGRLVHRAGV